jgi:hypothetical protein
MPEPQQEVELTFPTRSELCCVNSCVCCSMGYYCKNPQCWALKADVKASLSLRNMYVDVREQLLCVSVAVQVPINVSKLGGNASIACFGVTCKDCGEGYSLPKCCCGCEPTEPKITLMEDLCCRSGFLCCILGCNLSNCINGGFLNSKGYVALGQGLPCKMSAQGNVCCYNTFTSCPCDNALVPIVCSYYGLQCYPLATVARSSAAV